MDWIYLIIWAPENGTPKLRMNLWNYPIWLPLVESFLSRILMFYIWRREMNNNERLLKKKLVIDG